MLEDVIEVAPPQTVHRFASRPRATDRLSEIARDGGLDDEALRETLEFLGPADGEAEELIAGPFQPKPQLEGKWHPSRYTNGDWPIFYGALEPETSEAEIVHHLDAGQMKAALSVGRPVYYSLFHCTFDGRALDLRPKLPAWSWLTDPNTKDSRCQALGREAHENSVDGFLAPSARKSDGTCVPVFIRGRLSQPVIERDAVFSPNPATGTVQVRYL